MKVVIHGLEELSRKFERMAAEIQPALYRATEKAVLYVHGQVPDYPEPPTNSTYRRTGTLGRSIATEVKELGSGAVGTIGTAIVYAPWVISSDAVGSRGPQSAIHRGRWYTLQGVVKKAKDGVMRIYEKAIHDLTKLEG